jgi:hypothetical protein
VHTKCCAACGREFQAKRSDARHCRTQDCCRERARRRQEKSRRSRDPLIGSSERKQAQRDGLVLRKQIIRDLAARGLLAEELRSSSQDTEQDPPVYASAKWGKRQRRRPVGASAAPPREGRYGPGSDSLTPTSPELRGFARTLRLLQH